MSTPCPEQALPSSRSIAKSKAPEPTPRSRIREADAPPSTLRNTCTAASTSDPEDGRGRNCSSGTSNDMPRNSTTPPPEDLERCSANDLSEVSNVLNFFGTGARTMPAASILDLPARQGWLRATCGTWIATTHTHVPGWTSSCPSPPCSGISGACRCEALEPGCSRTIPNPSSCNAHTASKGDGAEESAVAASPLPWPPPLGLDNSATTSTRPKRPKWPEGPS
mmetsp:Transcript_24557/g.62796  ORF Transcript_24557/g.62796 Transcript_24557/m.62796 type:complete len:223 (+) Transcript_24557:725-1393(+)